MTTALATITTEADVDQALAWLTHLQRSPNVAPLDKAEVEATVAALSQPCDMTRTMARVAALLSPYYDKDIPQGVRQIEAEDWADAMAQFPDWAISKACKWWKSAANADRRKRPLEGDIAARCRVEMMAVRGMEIRLRSAQLRPWRPEPAPTPISRERAEEILAEVGFRPKRMEAGE